MSALLLNVVGYYGLLLIKDQHFNAVASRIEAVGNDVGGRLVLRYELQHDLQQEAQAYRDHYREVTYEGKVYHQVRSWIYMDEIFILFMSNERSTQIENTIAEFTSIFANPSQQSGFAQKTVKSITQIYLAPMSLHNTQLDLWKSIVHNTVSIDLYQHDAGLSVFHPPGPTPTSA
ncbi:MAG: hypothetical protein R2820_05820 [Cyclobacteriaceae bacterium]